MLDTSSISFGAAVIPICVALWKYSSKGKYVTDREECFDALVSLCETLYEVMAQADTGLCFLSDSQGRDIYIKAFGMTPKAAAYMDKLYARFEYTDACEMSEHDFPEFAEEFKRGSKGAVLHTAQAARGVLWDNAMNGHHIWKDAGLTFSLTDVRDRTQTIASMREAVKLM